MDTNAHERQLKFYKEVAAKYRPSDSQEAHIVYEMFCLLWTNRCMTDFSGNDVEQRRFAANHSLIAKLEQRLAFMQATWPKMEEKRTQHNSLHLVEKKDARPKTSKKPQESVG